MEIVKIKIRIRFKSGFRKRNDIMIGGEIFSESNLLETEWQFHCKIRKEDKSDKLKFDREYREE